MFLIHQTSNYTAFNTVNHTDFSFADASCNHESGNFAWFAVGADASLDWNDSGDFNNNIAEGSASSSIVSANCADDDTCGGIEYIAAIFPLDSCGTTAEMGKDGVRHKMTKKQVYSDLFQFICLSGKAIVYSSLSK